MKIAIIGTGHIGKSLVQKLSAAGHEVKVANSRDPKTIDAELLIHGAQAMTAADAVLGVDVVIISVPFGRLRALAPLVRALPANTLIIDTGNYYPMRDGVIAELEAGMVEGLWVADVLGRAVIKAWNAIGSESLAIKGKPKGAAGRIAIPVAGDSDEGLAVGMALVNDTGFDGVASGSLADSWRHQPGAPCYCTDLTAAEMAPALLAADRKRLPKRRDLGVEVILERMGDAKTNPDADFGVRVNRAINL